MKKFYVAGRGFIFPKHKEAIESIGGVITENYQEADYVSILTPNYLHYEMINQALTAGKKVICEKPLTLSSKECKKLIGQPVGCVFQLRYLPILNEIKEAIKKEKFNRISITVDLHRDEEYFNSWKGQNNKSGGILFNLGIHYFDLVCYLLGYPSKHRRGYVDDKESCGWFMNNNYSCDFAFSYEAPKDSQYRSFKINDKSYDLSEPENLHKKVYQDFINGQMVLPEESLQIIKLIEKLK